MWKNFQQKFRGDALKNQLWRTERSSTFARFEENMAYIKVLNHDA
jgi:hypothetical protein